LASTWYVQKLLAAQKYCVKKLPGGSWYKLLCQLISQTFHLGRSLLVHSSRIGLLK